MADETTNAGPVDSGDSGGDAPQISEEMQQFDFDEPADDYIPVDSGDDAAGQAVVDDGSGDDANSAEPVVQQPVLSPEDIARAKQFGLDESALGHFRSPEQLDMAIGLVAKAAQAYQKAQAGTQQSAPQQAGAQVNAGRVPKFELQFDPAVAEEVAMPIAGFADHVHGQISEVVGAYESLRNDVQQVLSAMAEQVAMAREERFDNFVTSLGEDWSDVFGKGSLSDLDPKSAEFANRLRLIQAAETMNFARKQTGAQSLRDLQAWKRGLNVEFGDKAAEKAVAKTKQGIVSKLQKNGKRITARPNGVRKGIENMPPGEARARAAIRAKLAEFGIDQDDSADETFG